MAERKVGTIMVSSWGYDQTNIDFYEVTGLIGKTMVELTPIASKKVYDDGPTTEVVPVPGVRSPSTHRDVLRKRWNFNHDHGWISLTSYSSARIWDGKPKRETGAGYGH